MIAEAGEHISDAWRSGHTEVRVNLGAPEVAPQDQHPTGRLRPWWRPGSPPSSSCRRPVRETSPGSPSGLRCGSLVSRPGPSTVIGLRTSADRSRAVGLRQRRHRVDARRGLGDRFLRRRLGHLGDNGKPEGRGRGSHIVDPRVQPFGEQRDAESQKEADDDGQSSPSRPARRRGEAPRLLLGQLRQCRLEGDVAALGGGWSSTFCCWSKAAPYWRRSASRRAFSVSMDWPAVVAASI